MPEGDTIHRLALQLRPKLVGETLTRVIVRGVPRGPVGDRVASVSAIGKHLVIGTEGGAEIRVHLGMNGRWYRVDADQPVSTGGDRTSLVLGTARDTFACRAAATVELTDRRDAARGLAVGSLGPDLLDPDFAPDAPVIDRVASPPATRAIGLVLLDQRVVAGVGNIWRCESLFRAGVDPRTPLADVDPDDVIRIYTIARDLMRERLDARRPPALAVYDRAGQPCGRCGSPIATFLLGERRAYACPSCQPVR